MKILEILNERADTLSYRYENQDGDIIPNLNQFTKHFFLDDKSKGKSFLTVKRKDNSDEFNVIIWELKKDGDSSCTHFSGISTNHIYYGSGLYSDKSGFGFTYIGGYIKFDGNGDPILMVLDKMPECTYHR